MAENKKSVILYTDLIHTFEQLTDSQAGRLIKHVFRYVNDQNPKAPDKITSIAFEPIRQQLKRDLKKWERYIEKQKENGKKGGRPKEEPNETQKTQAFSEEPKKADTATVSVNVNDNQVVDVEEEKKIQSFLTDQIWKEQFCMTKNISLEKLETLQNDFVAEKKLKGEHVNNYKKYFLYQYENPKNGTHQQPVRKSGKAGKSAGANILMASVLKDHERPGQ